MVLRTAPADSLHDPIDARVEAMGALEARRMLSVMVRHAGTDAAARVYPEGPFERHAPSAQLALGAVDARSARVEAERLGAYSRAALAVLALEGPELGGFVAHPGHRTALSRRWVHLVDEAQNAWRFDRGEGLALLDTVADELARTATWAAALGQAAPAADAVLDVASVLARADALLLAVCDAAFDEPVLRLDRLLALVARLNVATTTEAARAVRWNTLRTRVAEVTSPWIVNELAELLDVRARPDEGAMALLAMLADRDAIEPLSAAAVRWGDVEPDVVALLVNRLRELGRNEEADGWELG